MTEEFTKEEKTLLEPYFTNLDKNVFVLKNLPQVVCGTLFSRYSRSDKPLRRLLLDDFMNKPEFEFKKIAGIKKNVKEELIAVKKAEEFYDRVLVDFGDDSVAELGGAHVGIENVSQIGAKILEDSRIGLSPLEKSTRYIYFEKKVNGEYKYLREKTIMKSEFREEYVELCDFLFQTYEELKPAMRDFIKEKFPQEEVSDRAYKSTVKAKVCDIIRVFLPASTLTNLGLYGNGRAFEYLLQKMYSHPLKEMHDIGDEMAEELRKVIPSFVKRATEDDALGKKNIDFFKNRDNELKNFSEKFFEKETPEPVGSPGVELIEYDDKAEEKVIAGLLYPFTNLSEKQIREKVKKMNSDERKDVVKKCLGKKTNRRHKAGRGFENAYYKFDLIGNYGIYRDLHRHRMLTQERQLLTTKHGYDAPVEIIKAGFEKQLGEAMEKADSLFRKMAKKMPLEAQYVVPFGYRIRWYNYLNLRELYHLTELRATQAGHPDYRKIAQQMYLKVKEVHPALVEYADVDLKNYDFERIESEKGIDKKLEEIEKKYGK